MWCHFEPPNGVLTAYVLSVPHGLVSVKAGRGEGPRNLKNMNIEVFSLCDAATVDMAGELSVLGGFDTMWMANIPAVYPQWSIALRIRFQNMERGEHRVSVNFVDLDGKH